MILNFPSADESEDCINRLDDDFDGLLDCQDPTCAEHPNCREAMACADGIDNDADGRTDCFDSECFARATCLSHLTLTRDLGCNDRVVEERSSLATGFRIDNSLWELSTDPLAEIVTSTQCTPPPGARVDLSPSRNRGEMRSLDTVLIGRRHPFRMTFTAEFGPPPPSAAGADLRIEFLTEEDQILLAFILRPRALTPAEGVVEVECTYGLRQPDRGMVSLPLCISPFCPPECAVPLVFELESDPDSGVVRLIDPEPGSERVACEVGPLATSEPRVRLRFSGRRSSPGSPPQMAISAIDFNGLKGRPPVEELEAYAACRGAREPLLAPDFCTIDERFIAGTSIFPVSPDDVRFPALAAVPDGDGVRLFVQRTGGPVVEFWSQDGFQDFVETASLKVSTYAALISASADADGLSLWFARS